VIAGRTFHRLDAQRPDEAIISRSTAIQFFGDSTGQRAIGKRFREMPGQPLYTVVGVVGDARDTSLAAPPSQTVYFPQVPAPSAENTKMRNMMAIVVRTTGDEAATIRAVQQVIHDADATLPVFDAQPMRSIFRASMAQLSFTIGMLGAAAVVTLLLGAIGLYGVMAYVVTLRTRELGVRIALGASPSGVVAMLTRQGMVLALVGTVAGLALFAGVSRVLRSFLFDVAPTDAITIVSASLVLATTAALACWIPARRTGRLDPAEVLRAE
jgi:ABC-type antimicrobial peptide transport system permease subunit